MAANWGETFAQSLVAAGGETGRLIASYNWSKTSLGPLEAWPQSLKTSLGLLLRSPVPIVMLWGQEGIMLYNDAYSGFAGGRHPQLLGSKVREGWPEVADFNDNVMKVGLAGGTLAYKDQELTLYRHGRPEQVWMNLDYSPVPDESGQPAGVFAVVVETTEKVLAERARTFRSRLEERLRGLADPIDMMEAATRTIAEHLKTAQVGFGEVDPSQEHVIVHRDWNDGRIPSVVGTWRLDDFGTVFAADMRAGTTVAIQDVRQDPRTNTSKVLAAYEGIGSRAIIDVPLVHNGRMLAMLFIHDPQPRIWTPDEIALVEEACGRLWAAVERARAETALRRLNETLEQRVEERTAERNRVWAMSRDLFAIMGFDGYLKAINPAWETILGYDEATLLAMPFWEQVHPDDEEAIIAIVERLQRGEIIDRFEDRLRHKDGSWRWIAWGLVPEGNVFYAVGRDVTNAKEAAADLEQAQDALRQAQKMEAVGHLTGGIAHDFNNLLGAVVGSLELILRAPDNIERVRRLAQLGLQAAERGAKLTGQLLAFSRAQRIELKPVILSRLVDGMRDMLLRTLGPMVQLNFHLEDRGTPVLSDPTQIELAVLNLAINARDAMEGEGTLTITTTLHRFSTDPELKSGTYVELAVSDTGSGMSPEILARAFDPFFTTKDVGKGTGLGLSQVYGIARQAGGTARIESTPGMGTTVRLYLPQTDAEIRLDAEAGVQVTASIAAKATILVVDDDPDIRNILIDSLSQLGYQVIEAEDGASGLVALEQAAPDLMMVDFAMPGMNGAELARRARERHPDLPIIFASGYADTAAIESVSDDRTSVLRKPFRIEQLRVLVQEALGHRTR